MLLTAPNKYTTLSPNINTESFDHWSFPVLETLASCNYSGTCQMLLQIRPMSCLFVKLVLWWASVNRAHSLQYWLRLLSIRNIPPSPQLSLIKQHTHYLHQQSYFAEKRKINICVLRLCDVFLQFLTLSWAFSRQRGRSKWSRIKLGSGCTTRLLILRGTQRGEALSVGQKVV